MKHAIEVDNVSKCFRLSGGTRTLKSAALDLLRSRDHREAFWALKNASFNVKKGETVGIIGANGAGKSTLLALIASTMYPTSGTIRTEGSISSLLELGAGFHPDLSGRENVFLAGAIMGIPRTRMEERFDAIVDFAELHEYIDEPVKHYSSGMYVRLGFAVAVEVDPEILLIDEVLAVGDAVFEMKCLGRMADFRRRGKSMLIISHDLQTVQEVSDRIMLLEHGEIQQVGNPSNVVAQYQALSELRHRDGLRKEWGSREMEMTRIETHDAAGEPSQSFACGDEVEVRIHYHASARIVSPVFGFAISDDNGRVIAGSNCQAERITMPDLDGDGYVVLRIPSLSIAKGKYLLSFSVHSSDHSVNYHRLDNCFPIEVAASEEFAGVYLKTEWSIQAIND